MSDKILKLRKGRLGDLAPGHPWIYRNQLLKTGLSAKPGEIVSVVNGDGGFVGRGYCNPRSKIAVRLLTFRDEAVDGAFFEERIAASVGKRRPLLSKTNAWRAVFSESDLLPGLIADLYNDTLVFQVLTLGMERFKSAAAGILEDILKPKYVYEKSVSAFRKVEGLKNVAGWRGARGGPVVEIFEGKARFLVDVERGHKTGFYLDQRRSRLGMETIARGKDVLDLFSYTGAFAVSAAVHGASKGTCVDIKGEWLRLGRQNAALNGVSDRIGFMEADAFRALADFRASGRRFDIVVVDPPSFLKSEKALKSASKGYMELNRLAMEVLNEGGILATFSCSHSMPNEVFAAVLKEAASKAKKDFRILRRCHQDKDHPIVRAIPETEYLKGYFLSVTTEGSASCRQKGAS